MASRSRKIEFLGLTGLGGSRDPPPPPLPYPLPPAPLAPVEYSRYAPSAPDKANMDPCVRRAAPPAPPPVLRMSSWSSGKSSSPASDSPSRRTFSSNSICFSRVLYCSCALSPSLMRSVTTFRQGRREKAGNGYLGGGFTRVVVDSRQRSKFCVFLFSYSSFPSVACLTRIWEEVHSSPSCSGCGGQII